MSYLNSGPANHRAGMSLVALGLLLSGCYATVPATMAPAPGSTMVLELSDRGRISVVGQLGPEIRFVEGELLEGVNGGFAISVRTIQTLDGERSRWNGERLDLQPTDIRRAQEVRFSRGRTAVLAAGIAVAGYVFATSARIFGGGRSPIGGRPPPPEPG